MRKALFLLLSTLSLLSCTAVVQPVETPACLYETVQGDAGMQSFRTVEFSSMADCRQYRELCNRETPRCTDCCDFCDSH